MAVRGEGCIAVVGAGPVGLLAAALLSRNGWPVAVYEKRPEPPPAGMAIGVTGTTLAALRTIGLDRVAISLGVPVREAVVHGDRGIVGACSFGGLDSAYPFVLSLPQQRLQRLLEEFLSSQPGVDLVRGATLRGLVQDEAGLTLDLDRPGRVRAGLVLGCDGARSRVRECLGISSRERTYGARFCMVDLDASSGMDDRAHLYFTRGGSVESFPLPEGGRRWVVSEVDAPPSRAGIADRVHERTGIAVQGDPLSPASSFVPRRALAQLYGRDRAGLLGDAAHIMTPIGGHGMNVGAGDVADLVSRIGEKGAAGRIPRIDWAAFSRGRQRVFRRESALMAAGMRLGVQTGRVRSALRERLLRAVLGRALIQRRVAETFAMVDKRKPVW